MNRLDKELVVRQLVDTRTKAKELIEKGVVFVNNKPQTKVSFQVVDTDDISIKVNNIHKYVSRAGFKLEKALNVFQYNVADKIVMDIGSSTGGFTDCCLQNGAKKVIAIDVGTKVMHPTLRDNCQVELHENTNIKDVEPSIFNEIELIVIDVSFISLNKIINKFTTLNKSFDVICLIKPQFECGKAVASKYNGVIKSKSVHKDVINNVIKNFNQFHYFVKGLDFSPIKGGDGNTEYIAYFSNNTTQNIDLDIDKIINLAHSIIKE